MRYMNAQFDHVNEDKQAKRKVNKIQQYLVKNQKI